jgi:hypothetical protein
MAGRYRRGDASLKMYQEGYPFQTRRSETNLSECVLEMNRRLVRGKRRSP